MFLEQTEQFIICAWLEIQIQKCLFQQATLSQGKLKNNKKWEKMGKQEVSLHRDSAGMINGAHTLHAWTIWKTKLPAGTCFLFSPAVHKTQKAAQVPQSSWQPCMRRGLICFMKPLWDFFSSHRGPDQKQKWDANCEMVPATEQPSQLCRVPFSWGESGSSLKHHSLARL